MFYVISMTGPPTSNTLCVCLLYGCSCKLDWGSCLWGSSSYLESILGHLVLETRISWQERSNLKGFPAGLAQETSRMNKQHDIAL